MDEQLLTIAHAFRHVGSLAAAEARDDLSAATLEEIVQPGPEALVSDFGWDTSLLWWFVHRSFVKPSLVVGPAPADLSVSLIEIHEKPTSRDGSPYLSVRSHDEGEPGEPVLTPFPRVPELLMTDDAGATFGESSRAYRVLVSDTVARVNAVAPAASLLARPPRTLDAPGLAHSRLLRVRHSRRFRVRSEHDHYYSVFIEGYSEDTEPIPNSVFQDLRRRMPLDMAIENLGSRLQISVSGHRVWWAPEGIHEDEIAMKVRTLGFVEDRTWEHPGYGEPSTRWAPDA